MKRRNFTRGMLGAGVFLGASRGLDLLAGPPSDYRFVSLFFAGGWDVLLGFDGRPPDLGSVNLDVGYDRVAAPYNEGRYVLQFDPLDGSGNIDINASIGTIFSIHRRKSASGPGTLEDCLQPAKDICAAGYVIYGSSNMFVYSAGQGVHGFTLDPAVGEFFLSHPNLKMPERGDTYSVNEGNYHKWSKGVQAWSDWIKKDNDTRKAYRHRYIGAMVADLHRTLLRGGIFAYPADHKNADGKLRLLYEAAPFAFLAEQAGGRASSGTGPVRDILPNALHQRTPLYIGSTGDVEDAIGFLGTK